MGKKPPDNGKPTSRPLVSAVLEDRSIVETLHRPEENRTLFCVSKDGEWREEEEIDFKGYTCRPYSPQNNLLANGVVLLPSQPEPYGSESELLATVEQHIRRYVDLSPPFERVAAAYVLFSWVHDAFQEIPYLRVRGDFGSGKTRFLLIVGSLCYKPIFASGASTVSPLFRILDAFRGTLIVDEGDFRSSDEKAEIVKILNNGNAKGFPVLRTDQLPSGEFDPRAYHVFGPKLVGTRGFYEDRALESRFLTEDLGTRPVRSDVPINLPPEQRGEALELRNRLLQFRLCTLHRQSIDPSLRDPGLESRMNQILVPLLSAISDPETAEAVRALARQHQEDITSERGEETEALVLGVLRALLEAGETRLSVKEIAAFFSDRHGEEYERRITPRWMGSVLRKKLRLRTRKSDGLYVLPPEEIPKLKRLFEKYGLEEENSEFTQAEAASEAGPIPSRPKKE